MNRGDILRFGAGAGAALLLAGAGIFLWTGRAQQGGEAVVPAAPAAEVAEAGSANAAPAQPPSADERTREQRRFDRADRDNDGRVTLAELTYGRQRAFARLDVNHDGRLSFEEWAARTLQKFAQADANHDASLNRAEFAVTAPRRRAASHQARCNCAPQPAATAADEGDGNQDGN